MYAYEFEPGVIAGMNAGEIHEMSRFLQYAEDAARDDDRQQQFRRETQELRLAIEARKKELAGAAQTTV